MSGILEGTVSLCLTLVKVSTFRSNGMERFNPQFDEKFSQYEILEYRISMS